MSAIGHVLWDPRFWGYLTQGGSPQGNPTVARSLLQVQSRLLFQSTVMGGFGLNGEKGEIKGGGGVSSLGDVEKPGRHGPRQLSLGGSASSGELDKMTSRGALNRCGSTILFDFCQSGKLGR